MTHHDDIKRAAQAIAPGSAYTAEAIESLMAALCNLSWAEGKLEGVNEVNAGMQTVFALNKAAGTQT